MSTDQIDTKSTKQNMETTPSENQTDIQKDATHKGFTGYGCQSGNQHPFYRTTSKEYGWFPPDLYTVPSVYYPKNQKFSSHLAAAGMYRNYSLNTSTETTKFK